MGRIVFNDWLPIWSYFYTQHKLFLWSHWCYAIWVLSWCGTNDYILAFKIMGESMNAWTKTPPTEPGWYWVDMSKVEFLKNYRATVECQYISHTRIKLYNEGFYGWMKYVYWQGPLQVPEPPKGGCMKIIKKGTFNSTGYPEGWHVDFIDSPDSVKGHSNLSYVLGIFDEKVFVNEVEIVEWTDERLKAMRGE